MPNHEPPVFRFLTKDEGSEQISVSVSTQVSFAVRQFEVHYACPMPRIPATRALTSRT